MGRLNEQRHMRVDAALRSVLERRGSWVDADQVLEYLERRLAEIDAEFHHSLSVVPVVRYRVPVVGGFAHADTPDEARARALEADARGYFYALHEDGSHGDDVHVMRDDVAVAA
jgi:hypothetical protein